MGPGNPAGAGATKENCCAWVGLFAPPDGADDVMVVVGGAWGLA